MKKILILTMTLTLLSQPTIAETKKVNIRILETSDVHGCFFPYNFTERTPMKGSLARISSYVNTLRKEYGDNLILLENGDILQGQPICYYYNYIATEKENVAASLINYMGYDAQSVGNHDIETGHACYDKWIGELNCPTLGANIIDTGTGEPYVKPYIVIEREGVKIAILGMLTPAIPNWLNESLWKGLRFENMKESCRKWVAYIKENENPDIMVGLFHSGWSGGITTDEYVENETEAIAQEVDGFDIIFFGHDHTQRSVTIKNSSGGDVVCVDPSCNAIAVGDVSLELTIEGEKVVDKQISGKLTDISDQPIDEAFMEHFKETVDEVKGYVGKRIGSFEETIRTRDCFFGSAPFTDLIHNMQLQITGADISFNAPLSFDTDVNKGDIFVSDMFKLYRFENQIYVLRMTGKEVRKHLEMSYDLWVNTMTSPNDHIMLLDSRTRNNMEKYGFKNMTFNFDSAAGIDYEVDVTKPNGEKVRILRMSNGDPFDETKWYNVVMNSYRGNGGGELLIRGAGIAKEEIPARIIFQSELDQRYYLTQEIEKMGVVSPKANNNWKFVPDEWTAPALKRDRNLIFGD